MANPLQSLLPLKHAKDARFHWTAPNTLTFTGLLCMVVPSTVIMFNSKDLLSPSPVWAYFATAMGIFAYQILDELDGKQVRKRTACLPCPNHPLRHPRRLSGSAQRNG